jgi:hypothetical protein
MAKEEHYRADTPGRYLSMSSDPHNPHLLTIHESKWLNKGESIVIPPGATILLVVERSIKKVDN